MSSGRLQLASVGLQDFFLTENPDITYFQKVFKRHTNFTFQTLDNTFDNNMGFDTEVSCVIPIKGDLIRNIYLKLELPKLSESNAVVYTDSIGNAIIEHADLIIGGQLIERITGEYIEIHNQYFTGDSKFKSFEFITGTVDSSNVNDFPSANTVQQFIFPLPFYFFRHEPLCIPICALQYQEVEVRIKLRPLDQLYICPTSPEDAELANSAKLTNVTLPVEYVYLTDGEVKYFQSRELEYVITQIQLSTATINSSTNTSKFRLNFVNPVKEMFFAIQSSNVIEQNVISGNKLFDYSNPDNSDNKHHLKSLNLNFNNQTIIDEKIADTNFMFALQPLLYHSRTPKNSSNRLFYAYSFSLYPENYSPTGQINMSRIQNKNLKLNLTDSDNERHIKIYAKSYNILRIKNNLAGLLFIDNNTV